MSIAVLLIDDDLIVLSALKELLEKDNTINVVATASDAYAALDIVSNLPIDVALCDIVMPNGGGLEFLRGIAASSYDLPTVMMTNAVGEENLGESLRLGAVGYVTKDSTPQAYRDAVHQAINKSLTVSEGAVDLLRGILVHSEPQDQARFVNRMSGLEVSCLRLVCKGLSNAEIANELHYSTATIKKTLASLFEVFDVKSRAELAFQAATIGFR